MVSTLENKNINLNDYKDCDKFIYGLKGIVRLSIAREIMYRMGNFSLPDIVIEALPIYKIECIFAVTDKRIILIPLDSKYSPSYFTYGDIDVSYCNQIIDKVFLINMKDKKLLNFYEDKLVFRLYSNQNETLKKITSILQEYACA